MKFDIKKLVKILNADTESLLAEPNKYWNFKIQKGKNYLYIDRGANILGVAHLDTVADGYKYKDKARKVYAPIIEDAGVNDKIITSIKLDDRLGVFLLMDVLPYLGCRYDILLTTDEEIGMSTASQFVTKKEYNWMFEMDRRGYGNAVMYQYETKELKTALNSLDYRVEIGSFSDISELDTLGCCGINFGCGYDLEHTNACFVRTSWLSVVVNMFVDFYNAYNDICFEYVYQPSYSRYGGYYSGKYSTGTKGYDYSYGKSLTKTYNAKDGEWKEILSDRYDDEIDEVTFEPIAPSQELEIIPIGDDDYQPLYTKNGKKIEAYRMEKNGDWTPLGLDSNGDYYAIGKPLDTYAQEELEFSQSFDNAYTKKDKKVLLAQIEKIDDEDDVDGYLKYDSRMQSPQDYLHPEDFDTSIM